MVFGGIGEGHCAVVIGACFKCQQGDVVDAGDCLVDVALALPAKVEGSGL